MNDDDLGGAAASAAIAAAQVVATSTTATAAASATATASSRRTVAAASRKASATAAPETAVQAGSTLAGRLFRPDAWRQQQAAGTAPGTDAAAATSTAAQAETGEATLTGALAAAVAEGRPAKPARAVAAHGAKLSRWPLMTAAAFAGAVLVSVPFVHNGNRDTTTNYEGAGRPLPIASLDDPEHEGEHDGATGPDGYSSQMPDTNPEDGSGTRVVPQPQSGTQPLVGAHGTGPHLDETAVVPSTGPVRGPVGPTTGSVFPGGTQGDLQLPSQEGPFAEGPLVGVGRTPVVAGSGIPFATSLATGGTDTHATKAFPAKPKADPAPHRHTDKVTADPKLPVVKFVAPPAAPAVHTDAARVTHPTVTRTTPAPPTVAVQPAAKPVVKEAVVKPMVKPEAKPPVTQSVIRTTPTISAADTPAKPVTTGTAHGPSTAAVQVTPAVPATPATPAVPADRSKPAVVTPAVTPTVAKPATTGPTTTKPTTTKPDPAKPVTTTSVAKPSVTAPADASTTDKPAAQKPATDKPAADKPAADKPDPAESAADTPDSTSDAPVWHQKTIDATYVLNPGESVASNRMRITMRKSGSLVISDEDGVIRWSSHTPGQGNHAVFQDDGHFVVYGPDGQTLWSSGTAGNPGSQLVIQKDGDVTIQSAAGATLWSAGTAH
ncbi:MULTISPECIES: hypothetical protein [unclassified Streptomyces]|uniref:hypothetical protein n=1 Tax=unclassified Streptomyces TaxID=2593676 RepID=UPI000B89EADF|nr:MULTISPECIES: hypothetical protein [unclassified Streptomyces]MYS20672.1 hypothetical protein [Streptomyces sp. SID4948]